MMLFVISAAGHSKKNLFLTSSLVRVLTRDNVEASLGEVQFHRVYNVVSTDVHKFYLFNPSLS